MYIKLFETNAEKWVAFNVYLDIDELTFTQQSKGKENKKKAKGQENKNKQMKHVVGVGYLHVI